MWPFKRARVDQSRSFTPAPFSGDEDARLLDQAMRHGDWSTAGAILRSKTHPDDRHHYLAVAAEVEGVQDWIGKWIAAEPDDILPLLVRGCHAVYWAWEARGAGRAVHTSPEQFKGFFARLKFAEDCLFDVTERDPDEVAAWSFLVASARGRQVGRDEAMYRFDEAVRRHPTSAAAHEHMLQYLCQKWSGSHEDMFQFARRAAARAPGTQLPGLVADAHVEMWLALGGPADYFEAEPVRAELRAAADRSIWHPGYERRPGWSAVFNTFAFVFSMADDYDAAASAFDAIGSNVTADPWCYLSKREPLAKFLYWRDTAYTNRS